MAETGQPIHAGEVLYRDYVMIDGRKSTPDKVRAAFALMRQQCMDLPLHVTPIVQESLRVPNPQYLSENDKYALDVAEYNLDDPTADGRIKNEFQYFEHVMRGLSNNISVLLQRKRVTTRQANDLEILATNLFNELKENSTQDELDQMGKSEAARQRWFDRHFPALYEIRRLYAGMLAELEAEKERLSLMNTTASRSLTAVMSDYQVRGEMGGIRMAGHNENGSRR